MIHMQRFELRFPYLFLNSYALTTNFETKYIKMKVECAMNLNNGK